MDDILFASERFVGLLLPLAVLLIVYIVTKILRRVLYSRLNRWAKHTATDIDDILIEATQRPSVFWCLMAAIYFAVQSSRLPDSAMVLAHRLLAAAFIASFTWVAATLATRLIRSRSQRLSGALPFTSLSENISRILVFGLGGLMMLNGLGISITPILATLGVGSLAVALALQDTLSNLFSGVHITIAHQIKIGDYVKLETGEEGYVTDINWRTTQIRMLPNNVVLIPNSKLTQAIVTNYYLPEKEMSVTINVGVHYNSDLERVERVTCEVAKEVMKEVPGGVPAFDPFIRFHTFNDFSVDFTAILRAKEFADQYLIKHEFVKRLHRRYAKEGIVIPYPIEAVNYEQENGPGSRGREA